MRQPTSLWEKHGRNYSVLAMGTAGERLVNLSVCLVDKTTTWGKGGLPAVMGFEECQSFHCVWEQKRRGGGS